jgi:hypothetical protein
MPSKKTSYEGNPILKIWTNNERYNMCFGLTKARNILANIEAIKEFVATASGEQYENTPTESLDDVNPDEG